MLSPDFGIPLLPGRMTPEQVQALDVSARLVLWLVGTANAQRGTFYVNLGEFAAWAGCSHKQASRAMDELAATGWVVNVKRRSHGISGQIGEMFRRPGDPDQTMAARVYQKVFGVRAHADDRHRMRDEVGTNSANLKLWAGVCADWQKGKRNPADLDGLLKAYARKRDIARKVLLSNNNQEADYSGYKDGE